MRIKITDVELSKEKLKVGFSTEYGNAYGEWQGQKPTVGEIYDVEVDIDKKLVWNRDISYSAFSETKIFFEKGISIVAQVERSQEGLIELRLGNTLLAIEVDSDLDIVNKYVQLTVEKIILFPF